MATVNIKRIYEDADTTDGYRVLVDRLWPRGIKKERAAIDEWLKEIAPSPTLRKWFNHDPEKWTRFKKDYLAELKTNEAMGKLKSMAKENNKLTLLYAARDEKHNHAVILQQLLSE
jgi:uncharacterized protein YeaO (DUF488 family)